jgi:hypothetical protein
MGMNWYYVGAGAICLFIGWQFSQDDMIGASISCETGYVIWIIHRAEPVLKSASLH